MQANFGSCFQDVSCQFVRRQRSKMRGWYLFLLHPVFGGFQYATLPREYCKSMVHQWRPQPIFLDSNVYFLCSDDTIQRYVRCIVRCEQEKFIHGVVQQNDQTKSLYVISRLGEHEHLVVSSMTTASASSFDICIHEFNEWYSTQFEDINLYFECPFCTRKQI